MSLATGVTLMGRKQAEALMESAVVIKRAGAPTEDANGVLTPTYTTIYSGKCRLRITEARSDDVAAAGQALAKQFPILSIPVNAAGSGDVRVDDVASVTSPLDPYPTTARIAGVHSQTHSTARRFPVEVTN